VITPFALPEAAPLITALSELLVAASPISDAKLLGRLILVKLLGMAEPLEPEAAKFRAGAKFTELL